MPRKACEYRVGTEACLWKRHVRRVGRRPTLTVAWGKCLVLNHKSPTGLVPVESGLTARHARSRVWDPPLGLSQWNQV